VPWYDPYVCIEPVSNANDGFNRAVLGVPGHDVVTLNPGETLEGSLRIETEDRNTA
jgi:aldose 1-epimerase